MEDEGLLEEVWSGVGEGVEDGGEEDGVLGYIFEDISLGEVLGMVF